MYKKRTAKRKMANNQKKAKSIDEKFNKILKGIWEVLKHPVTILAIGTTIAIIGIVRGRTTKEPIFVVSPPELIAQTVPEEEKLKILWEENKIPNVALVKIGIWNQGSRYIDKSDISSTNPIRIKPLEKVDILAVQVLKTSRTTLNFDYKVETDADGIETVLIKIKGDEAVEKFDGGLFHVLFSGKREVTWKVVGRIKGVPEGFQEKDWERLHKAKKALLPANIIFPVGIALFFFFLIIRVIITIKDVRKAKRRKEVIGECVSNAILFLLFLAFLLIVIREYYYYLSKPPWL